MATVSGSRISPYFSQSDFEESIDQFEVCWQSGVAPAIRDFLPSADTKHESGCGRHELLVELIMIDMERRWDAAATRALPLPAPAGLPIRPRLEDYLNGFPELGTADDLPVALVAWEYELRRKAGDSPSHDDFLNRYSTHRDVLKTRLLDIDRQSEVARTMSVRRIRCPHCRTGIDVPCDSVDEELKCDSCGGTVRLVSRPSLANRLGGKNCIGRFELLDELGAGTFGTVYRARDTRLNRIVALKLPRLSRLDEASLARFLDEARAAAQLKHSHIVSVYEVGSEADAVFIVSDLIEGRTLDKWLRAERPAPNEAARLCRDMARALHHAHSMGIVHRDVKPSNVIVDRHAEPHLMDFGLAKQQANETLMTVDGQILGTAAYMPPEQARGEADMADARSDVYSLGVVLFELLTGECPFRGNMRMVLRQVLEDEPPRPRTLDHHVPRDLETICLKCLNKEPRRRYQTADELADDLERFLCGEAILARPITRFERAWKWAKRRPAVAMLIATSVVAVAAVGVGAWNYGQKLDIERRAIDDKRAQINEELAKVRSRLDDERRSTADEEKKDLRGDANGLLKGVETKIPENDRFDAERKELVNLSTQLCERNDDADQREKSVAKLKSIEKQFREGTEEGIGLFFPNTDPAQFSKQIDICVNDALAKEKDVAPAGGPLWQDQKLKSAERTRARLAVYQIRLIQADALARSAVASVEARDTATYAGQRDGREPDYRGAIDAVHLAQVAIGGTTRATTYYLRNFGEKPPGGFDAHTPPGIDTYHIARRKILTGPASDAIGDLVGDELKIAGEVGHWARFLQALCYLTQERATAVEIGNAAKALEHCQELENVAWYQVLVGMAYSGSDPERAMKAFSKAANTLDEQKGFTKGESTVDAECRYVLHMARGRHLRSIKEWGPAGTDFSKACELKPHLPEPLRGLGEVRFEEAQRMAKPDSRSSEESAQKLREAVECFGKAIKNVKRDGAYDIAIRAELHARRAKANQQLAEARQNDDVQTDVDAWLRAVDFVVGNAQVVGDWLKAIELEITPVQRAEHRVALAKVYENLGEDGEALVQCAAANRDDSENAAAVSMIAAIHAKEGDLDALRVSLNRAIDMNPNPMPILLLMRGLLAGQNGNVNAEIEDFSRGVDRARKEADRENEFSLLALRGLVYLQIGATRQAKSDLDEALRLVKDDADFRGRVELHQWQILSSAHMARLYIMAARLHAQKSEFLADHWVEQVALGFTRRGECNLKSIDEIRAGIATSADGVLKAARKAASRAAEGAASDGGQETRFWIDSELHLAASIYAELAASLRLSGSSETAELIQFRLWAESSAQLFGELVDTWVEKRIDDEQREPWSDSRREEWLDAKIAQLKNIQKQQLSRGLNNSSFHEVVDGWKQRFEEERSSIGEAEEQNDQDADVAATDEREATL